MCRRTVDVVHLTSRPRGHPQTHPRPLRWRVPQPGGTGTPFARAVALARARARPPPGRRLLLGGRRSTLLPAEPPILERLQAGGRHRRPGSVTRVVMRPVKPCQSIVEAGQPTYAVACSHDTHALPLPLSVSHSPGTARPPGPRKVVIGAHDPGIVAPRGRNDTGTGYGSRLTRFPEHGVPSTNGNACTCSPSPRSGSARSPDPDARLSLTMYGAWNLSQIRAFLPSQPLPSKRHTCYEGS